MKRRLSLKQKTAHKEWNTHLSGWLNSGLSQSKFCIEKGLNLRTFQYWKRKFSHSRKIDTKQEDKSIVKVVQLKQEKISSSQIDLPRSGSGIKLQVGNMFVELDNHFNQDALLILIRVLKAV